MDMIMLVKMPSVERRVVREQLPRCFVHGTTSIFFYCRLLKLHFQCNRAGWQAKMAAVKFGYHHVMRTGICVQTVRA